MIGLSASMDGFLEHVDRACMNLASFTGNFIERVGLQISAAGGQNHYGIGGIMLANPYYSGCPRINHIAEPGLERANPLRLAETRYAHLA